MDKFVIVFIHGYTSSSHADWYPEIAKELDHQGIEYVIPDLPGGEHPHAEEWMDVLHQTISQIEKPLVLVGHSLGTRAALLYLEKYRPKVEAVVLIAPFANRVENAERKDDGRAYADFFQHPIDLSSIKPLVGKFIVVHSKDDSSIEYEQGVGIANDLDAEIITLENHDHLSDPENTGLILEIIQKEVIDTKKESYS